jgi:hypothetical protein
MESQLSRSLTSTKFQKGFFTIQIEIFMVNWADSDDVDDSNNEKHGIFYLNVGILNPETRPEAHMIN